MPAYIGNDEIAHRQRSYDQNNRHDMHLCSFHHAQ